MSEKEKSQSDAQRHAWGNATGALAASVERSGKDAEEERSHAMAKVYTYAMVSTYVTILVLSSIAAIVIVLPEDGIELSWLRSMSLAVRQLLLVTAGAILGSSLGAIKDLMASLESPVMSQQRFSRLLLDTFIAVPLVLMSYFLICGLLLKPEKALTSVNPYGIFFVSVGVGIWGPNAFRRMTHAYFDPEKVERQLDNIGAALGVATLDNYNGVACLAIRDMEGNEISRSSKEMYQLICGWRYRVAVWFQPNEPKDIVSAKIEVSGGTDVSRVEFSVAADSDRLKFEPRNNTVSFDVRGRSPYAEFEFIAPASDGEGGVWVEILQKNRLLQVLSLTVRFSLKDQ